MEEKIKQGMNNIVKRGDGKYTIEVTSTADMLRCFVALHNDDVLFDLWIELADCYKAFCEWNDIKIDDYEDAHQMDEAMGKIKDISDLEQARERMMRSYLGDLADEPDIIDLLDGCMSERGHEIGGNSFNTFRTVLGWGGEDLFYSSILND